MTDNKKIKIGFIQLACTTDKQENISRTINKIEEAASKGAQVVCLQELFASRYFCDTENYDNFALADTIPGTTFEILSSCAKKNKIIIVSSLFEKRARGLYHNTAAVFEADGQCLGIYRKQHIPDDPGYYEKFYFTPGDGGYLTFNTSCGTIGVLICWDQWYPEPARICALKGAEIIFYPTAIGWAKSQDSQTNREQYDAWQTMQRSHAIANGVYVVSVNRTGQEGQMQFWGGSFIADPFGRILHTAPTDQEQVHVQEFDLALIDYYRTHWPFLRDRRIDTYQPILERYIDKKHDSK